VAYVFGDVELDMTTYEVRRAGHRVPLEPQAFDVLAYLVQHRERVVPKEELMDRSGAAGSSPSRR
jgi:DNA-binding response OmpR family regulator